MFNGEKNKLQTVDEYEKEFLLGHPVSQDKLTAEHWDVPQMHEHDDLILKNAYNHKFEEGDAVEVEQAAEEEALALPTLEEVEAIRQEAYQEGYKQGFDQGQEKGYQEGIETGQVEGRSTGQAQGLEEGRKKGLTEAGEMLEQFQSLTYQLHQPLENMNQETEMQLLELVSLLAKGVIMHELKTSPEQIAHVIKLGIEALPAQNQAMKIRLHHDDAALVSSLFDEYQRQEMHWELEVDSQLQRGEVKIDTEYSHVDLTLEKRIQKVFSELDQLKGSPTSSALVSASADDSVSNPHQVLEVESEDANAEVLHAPEASTESAAQDASDEAWITFSKR